MGIRTYIEYYVGTVEGPLTGPPLDHCWAGKCQAKPLAVTRIPVGCYCDPPWHTAHANRGETKKEDLLALPKAADQVGSDSNSWNARIP